MGRSKAALAGLGIVVSVLIMMLLGMRVMADDTNTGSGCNQSGSYGTISWSIEPYNDDGCGLTIGPGQGDDSQPSWTSYTTNYNSGVHIVHVMFTDPIHTVFGGNANKAFSNMRLVNSGNLDIKDVDMSHVRTMEGMFANTNMDAPLDLDGNGWHDTANLTTMANMFSGFHAPGLNGVGRVDTSNVTDLSNMFHGANFGDSVLDVSGMNTSKVRNMSELFHWTQAADIRGFENWDMSSVTRLDRVISARFRYNRTIDLHRWNLNSMKDLQDTFEGLKADGLDLSGWKLPNLTSSNHFLTSADIDKVNLTGWEIGAPCVPGTYCQTTISEMFNNSHVGSVVGINTWKLNGPTSINLELWSDKAEEFDFSGLDVHNIMYMQDSIVCSPNIQSVNLSNIDFTGKTPDFTNRFIGGVLCDSVRKVNLASTILDSSATDYNFRFPRFMNELTIGKDVHLNDQSMENVGSNQDGNYTGRWVEVNSGPDDKEHFWESQSTNPADSARELAARSREGHAGTYIRQRKVTITYDRNTEDSTTGIPNHDETVWPDLGEGTALPKDVNRDGYRLKGWNTAKDGSGQSYQPGERVHLQNSMTLYAQWAVRTKTAIRFNANGGDPDTKPEDIETGTRTSIAIPCGTAPTMPGSTFIGWSRTKSPVLEGADAGKNGKVEACGYSENTSIAVKDDESIDLYAVWARNPKAVFNENRPKDMIALLPETRTITGDWYMSGLKPRTYVGPDLSSWYKGYTPDGVYRFDGWTNDDGSPFTGVYLDRDDVTINAKWTRIANDTSGNGDTDDNSSDPGNDNNHNNSGNNDGGNDNTGQTNGNQSDHSGSSGNTANQNGSGQPSSSSGATTDNDSEANNQQTFGSYPNSSGLAPSTGSSNADSNNESKEPSNDEATTGTANNEDPTVRSVPLAKTGASVIGSIAMGVVLMVIGFGAVMTARRHHHG